MRLLLGGLIVICAIIGIRYYAANTAVTQMTSHISRTTTEMTAKLQRQSEAAVAKLSQNQAVETERTAKQRQIDAVVGCARNAGRDKCHCYDNKGQQVPGIADDLCLKVVDGGLNWLKMPAANEGHH
ncbi:hypothetical protein [Chitinimonas naiadis]